MSNTPLTDAVWNSRRPDSPITAASELDSLCRRLERDRAELIEALQGLLLSATEPSGLDNDHDAIDRQRFTTARSLLTKLKDPS